MENMNKIIKWHKEYANKFMELLNIDWYALSWVSWVKGLLMGIILACLLSGCYVTSYNTDPIYEDLPHTTEVYYNGLDLYFGFDSGFYYYYGVPHYYPWWYYYQFLPPHNHQVHTHVHVHCDNGHYVYKHRGPKFHNTGPDCPTNNGHFITEIKLRKPKSKTNVFPHNWKSSNSTRLNKQSNINKIDYNRIFNVNPQTNIKPINNNNNTINKGNNGSKRSNKTNTTRKPK